MSAQIYRIPISRRLAFNQNFARRRLIQPIDKFERRRFPTTRFAQQHENFAVRDLQI